VQAAKARLAAGRAVIPCELSGSLHGNWTGHCRGFSSLEAMRQYYATRVKAIRDVNGDILRFWPELDADFTLQHCGLAGAAMPPYRKLQPKVREAMAKQAALYQRALRGLSDADVARARRFSGLWPEDRSADELKEACRQPEDATTMRLTYAAGLSRLEPLYLFSLGLARLVGSKHRVAWSVKRPLRLWKKTIESYPDEFAKHDFRHCCDVYRTSVVVDSLEQVEQMLDLLEGLGREARDPQATLRRLGLGNCRAEFVVERVKNRFATPCPGGYMDVIVNLRINGYVTELQLQVQALLGLRGDTGRALYKWFRPFQRDCQRAADGKPHAGSGTLYPLVGGRYTGEFQDGQRHGRGTLYYTNGDRYEGDFEKGKKQGSGTYHYNSGERYCGGFEEDRMHGRGVWFCANGERFEGEYVEGKRHGAGAYYYRNGNRLQGEWWRNKYVQVLSV